MSTHQRIFIWFFFSFLLVSSKWACSSPAQVLGQLTPCVFNSDCFFGKGRCVKNICVASFAEPRRQQQEPIRSEPVLEASKPVEFSAHEPKEESIVERPVLSEPPQRQELSSEPVLSEPPQRQEPLPELVLPEPPLSEPQREPISDASVPKEALPEKDPCQQQAGQPCFVPNEKGICRIGLYVCKNGVSFCESQNKPAKEICDDPNKMDEDCDGKANEQDEDCKPNPLQCAVCNKPADCGASVTGYDHLCIRYPNVPSERNRCYIACRTQADCLKGFECRVYKLRSKKRFCWPPRWRNVGDYQYARWFCRNYEKIGHSCKYDWNCGPYTPYADGSGRECRNKKCTLHCDRDSDCPKQMKCKKDACQ